MMNVIRKELTYGLRSNIFLILLAGFLFFALLTPVMSKVVLPELLKSQFPNMPEQQLGEMLNMNQLEIIRGYMGDAFQIGSVIVAFVLCGLIAQEIRENTLVLPLCSGKHFSEIVGAKMVVFGSALFVIPITALLIDYYYAGLLFSFEIGIIPVIRAGLLQGLFMNFLLASLVMWGSLIKKPVTAGFLALITVFGLYGLAELFKIHKYLPSGLLVEANQLTAAVPSSLLLTLCLTIGLIIVFIVISLLRLKSMEWNERV